MDWQPFGKLLIAVGGLLIFMGLAVHFGFNLSFFGRLPGDIRIERPNFVFFFPLTSCLLVSLLLSILAFIISRLRP